MILKRLYILVTSLTVAVGFFLIFSPESYSERQKLFTKETPEVVLGENLNNNDLLLLYEKKSIYIASQEEEAILEKTKGSVLAVSDIEIQENILPVTPNIKSLDGTKESVLVSDDGKQEKNIPTVSEKAPLVGTKISIPAVSDVEKQENDMPEVHEKAPLEATKENVKGTLNKKSELRSLSIPVGKDYSRSKQAQEKREAR